MGTPLKKKLPKKPLEVAIAGLKFKNPVMTASGTFGYGAEFAPYTGLEKLGAIVVKGLSLYPRQGNPGPRIVETPCGMLNAIGLQNVGVDEFIEKKLPLLKDVKTHVIANIFGETIDDYMEVARRLDRVKGVSALEINISCPNVKKGGIVFGTDPQEAFRVVSAIRKSTSLPLITKLSPNVTDIKVMVKAAEDAGTDAISLINTLTGMVIDVERRRPVLATATGGLSGPAIRPVAVRMVWQAAQAAKVPLIGMGGIMNARDALEFIIAGAAAVQVGTASFIDPDAAAKVASGIEEYVQRHGVSVRELTGSLKLA
ncbi:dihydroorotate dehydrogenase (NAD+) catalytic subunit [uncultured bacterium]|nr:dihydroorotate dehydrogenase (NAD+) catalytic subunit [uncultured bacterium]